MQLEADGIEYAHWDFTGVPDGAGVPEVFLAGAWHPMAWVDGTGAERSARILVAGPDAVDPGSAVVLGVGRVTTRVRLVDAPEVIVRDSGGSIDVG